MNTVHSYNVNKQFAFIALVCALFIHMSIIPLSKLIKINNQDIIEPKVILDLINELEPELPIPINPIKSNQEIKIDKPKPIKRLIDNEVSTQIVKNDINIKEDNINIQKPKPIENIEKMNQPEIIQNIENIPIFSKSFDSEGKKIINETRKIIKPVVISNINTENINKNINYNSTPPKFQNSIEKTTKPILKKNNTNKNIPELTQDQVNSWEKYKNNIRAVIQSFALENYPKKLQRRRVEGKVQLIFKLNTDGSILSINYGPKTEAPKELIDAAIKAIEKSAPFETNDLLKKKNEFSIDIIYKIQ
tara:strand:+ start:1616 stop:2530 length:915 start_codon:yes stop_codon:yes gene_type:complete